MRKSFLFFLVISLNIVAQNKDSIAVKYATCISTESLKKNLIILASDEYEGRETGRKGQKMAAEYIANQFKASGILPFKQNQYYQDFLLDEKLPGLIQLFVSSKKFKSNRDYYTFAGEINTKVKKVKISEVTFLGYGIEEANYNDYQNVDVKNKTIMILSGEPLNKDSISLITGNKTKSHWTDKTKIKKAKEKGVTIVLIVKENIDKEIQKNKHRLESSSMSLKDGREEISVVYISKKVANIILSGTTTVDKLKEEIGSTQKSLNLVLNKQIKIKIKTEVKQMSAENVLGYIEGSDLKKEVIVISAHYDHLGIKDNKVYNGADDDGSGTVALIELAKVFEKAKKEGHGPKRSILFIAFSGEEKGLLGSSYYVEHPEFPLANTVCDLNIDMIGRMDAKHDNNPDYVYLIGADKLSSELNNISETTNQTYTKLELDYTYNDEKDKNRFYYRSDHYNFAKNGIPVIFYFNGVHEDYHQETDEVQKINFEKIQKISDLVFFTAWEIANRTERIKIDSNKK